MLPYSRQVFIINTDTGTQGDTGPPFSGEIHQMRWYPTTADTGADLVVMLRPEDDDTGSGWIFYNNNDVLGTQFTIAPRMSITTNIDGTTDTGWGTIMGAGDRLRVKVTPGGAACVGKLWVWIR